MLEQITPVIITYNEAPNLHRTLRKLTWARQIIVVDSGSADDTCEILSGYSQVLIVPNRFINFETQWNLGLSRVTSPWVLSLDADYELSDELIEELRSLEPPESMVGYRAEFVYRVHGRSLRGSLYPSRIVLFRRGQGRYRQEGHTQQLIIPGETPLLKGKIYHDDRKSLARWFGSQIAYARDEANYLLSRKNKKWVDRIRAMGWPAPFLVFFYTLVVKRCAFDGWHGWYYVLQRVVAEILLALELIDKRLRIARSYRLRCSKRNRSGSASL